MAKVLTDTAISRFLARGHRPGEAALDRIYARFKDSDPFQPVTGFVDHVTMGAEALVGLGLGDRVEAWASGSRARPYRAPMAGIAIESDWRNALGRKDNHGDWIAYFDAALARRPYAELLAVWVPRFVHAPEAALFHGLIRTGHATRALGHGDTPERRTELARALALWAISIRRGPAETAPGRASLDGILDDARRAAAAFVQTPSIVALHYVTGPMGYMLLGNYLDARAHGVAAAGFARSHAHLKDTAPDRDAAPPTFDRDRIAALAETANVHAIKLTEAAFRAYDTTEDALFLRAAAAVRY